MDTKKTSVVEVNGNDFEDASNVYLGQLGSLACKVDEGDGMIDCCILHGEAWVRD